MKRKIIFCTFAMSALLLSGCSRNYAKGSELSTTPDSSANSAEATPSTNATHSTNTTHSADASQSTDTTHSTDSSYQNGTTGSNTAHTTDSSNQNGTTGSNTTHNNTTSGTKISEEEAKRIALSHAGLTTDQVTFIKSGIDRDDDREYYDVEFYTKDHKEYDYEIDPHTGDVVSYDYDAEYYTSSTDTAKGERISEDAAKKIALDKVPGATAQDIREFKTDSNNGKLEYEGKIYYGQKEYEFEIDGYSGAVLEWDVETIYGGV